MAKRSVGGLKVQAFEVTSTIKIGDTLDTFQDKFRLMYKGFIHMMKERREENLLWRFDLVQATFIPNIISYQ